jgi:L-ascorbate metabolism protein UlaG (beta-lactamase superfamily)
VRRLAALILLLAAAPAAAQAQAQVAPDTVATRVKFFGAANVDPQTGAVRPDRAIFTWFGVTNFAVAMRGHVFLLDAWVPRGEHSGYVPTTPEELAKLKPEAIVFGHAHFDHAADAVPIAEASGAQLVGTAEHCAVLRERAAGRMPPRCLAAIPAGAGFGTTRPVPLFDDIEVVAVKHLHSGSKQPDGSDSGGYHVPVLSSPSTTSLEHPPTPQDVAHLAQHAPDAEGGSVLYRFKPGGTTFLWHDTSGPLVDEAPKTFDAFRALRPIDVEIGAIQGFNQITNGMRDPRLYVEAFAPRLFVPTHHENWLPGITTTGDYYEAPWREELQRMPAEQRPEVRFINDPRDYVNPPVLTFPLNLGAPRLVRRCIGAGRLRVELRGELGLVRGARFRFDSRRTRTATTAPYRVTFTRTQLSRTRSRRLTATVTTLDGPLALKRTLPRCGLR